MASSTINRPQPREALSRIRDSPASYLTGESRLSDHPVVTADTLLAPTRTGFAPATAPWARYRLTALLRLTPRPRRRHLLISRRLAQRRRLLNEGELAQALTAHGFESIELDTMPFHDQLRTIHESLTIVSVHGAALAHLLYAPPGGHVIEITHPDAVHPEYLGLAALAGWHHTFALAEPAPTDPTVEAVLQDLRVDIDAILRSLTAPPPN